MYKANLATLGNNWQHLATLGNTWQHLATLGNTWQHLATLGNNWQHFALSCKGFPLTCIRSLKFNFCKQKLGPIFNCWLYVCALN